MVAHKLLCALFIGLMAASAAGLAEADSVGAVVKAVPGAKLGRSGKVTDLATGQTLSAGDLITTNRSGTVQILFEDDTRIAIGPNASFLIDDIQTRRSGVATRFAVSAVAGGYRFLTGRSPKSAYAINTPTATMGIRGTAFDFLVRSGRGTDVVIFSGLVRMCGSTGACFRVTGECNAVRMGSEGTAFGVAAGRARRAMISEGFVFLTQPRKLARDFQVNMTSCGRDVAPPAAPKSGEDRRRAAPNPPDPPEPPDPPDPDPPL